ncbi:hypothetical protein D3C78_1230750 [compost metagenome]
MATGIVSQTQYHSALRLIFGGIVRHESFTLEGPQAGIQFIALGGVAAVQVDLMPHAPSLFAELAGEIQARRGRVAGQNIEVNFAHGQLACRLHPGT